MNTSRILVEGKNDWHIVGHLLQGSGIPLPDCRERSGIEELLKHLQLQIEDATDWDRLGVIVDADIDPQAQWSRIIRILAQNEYPIIPAAPVKEGAIIENEEGKRIGIWIMPDNSVQGSVEDFMKNLIPMKDPLWPRADRVVDEIPSEHRRFKATYLSKAKIHTWLAWQEEPGTPMGSALTKKYFDAGAPHARAFITWIRRLLA